MIRDQRGFTLAEILVAAAVLSMMMAALLIIQQQGQFAYITGAARVETQQNARWALDSLTGDLRSAQPTGTSVGMAIDAGCGTGPIPSGGGASTITFTIPDDPNPPKPVQYGLVGTNLVRTIDGTPTTITPGVEDFRLWCLDTNGDLTATAGSVRSLHVRIRTRSEQATAGAGPHNQHATLDAQIRLRNLL
ncbi:MAG TPA: type II secretion system protein [Gemmatimonadales bacterium]|nr:type II secretion system protein [Gemmatimonadales bacterium]